MQTTGDGPGPDRHLESDYGIDVVFVRIIDDGLAHPAVCGAESGLSIDLDGPSET